MRKMLKALFVTAMAFTLIYSVGAGVSFAAGNEPAYSDFIYEAIPDSHAAQTPDMMGAWE